MVRTQCSFLERGVSVLDTWSGRDENTTDVANGIWEIHAEYTSLLSLSATSSQSWLGSIIKSVKCERSKCGVAYLATMNESVVKSMMALTLSYTYLVGCGQSFFVCCLVNWGSTDNLLLLQISRGVVWQTRDLHL